MKTRKLFHINKRIIKLFKKYIFTSEILAAVHTNNRYKIEKPAAVVQLPTITVFCLTITQVMKLQPNVFIVNDFSEKNNSFDTIT